MLGVNHSLALVHSIPSSQYCLEIEYCSVQAAHEPVSIISEKQKRGFNTQYFGKWINVNPMKILDRPPLLLSYKLG